MNVGIVGLGLIGGSMAKSIKVRTANTVWGIDLDAETMTLSRLSGAIDDSSGGGYRLGEGSCAAVFKNGDFG